MKAWLWVGGWLLIGAAVAARGQRTPAERALVAMFWPFFLFSPAQARGPLERLRSALPADDPAATLVDQLAVAIADQRARLQRLAIARTETDVLRSREQLEAALRREQQLLADSLAAIEDAATHLWLMRDAGRPVEIRSLLQGLADRIAASREISEAPPPTGPRSSSPGDPTPRPSPQG